MRSPLTCWLVLLLLTLRFSFCWELNERQIPAVVINSRLLSQHEFHSFPPLLYPVLLPSPCSAGAGAEAGSLSNGQGVVGLLASERLPARCPLHPGMEKLLLRGHADTDSACVALSPAVGAQRVMLQGDRGSACFPGTKQGVLTQDTRGRQDRQNVGRLRDEKKHHLFGQRSSQEFSLHRLSVHFSVVAVRWGLGCKLS